MAVAGLLKVRFYCFQSVLVRGGVALHCLLPNSFFFLFGRFYLGGFLQMDGLADLVDFAPVLPHELLHVGHFENLLQGFSFILILRQQPHHNLV